MSQPQPESSDDTVSPPKPEKDPLRGSKTSGVWFVVVALAVLLLVLVIFIAQNTQRAQVSFLWWDGNAPVAVSLLIASVVGILIAVVAGTLRIFQLRRRVRRVRH